MAFALLIIGILLLVSAIRNTQGNLVALFKTDFTGSNNFVWWVVAILIIGAIGYVQKLKALSDGLLVLLILVLFLSRGNPKFNPGGGFFSQFVNAIGLSKTGASGVTSGNSALPINVTSGGGGGIGVILPPITIGGGGSGIGAGLGFGNGAIPCDPIIDFPWCNSSGQEVA